MPLGFTRAALSHGHFLFRTASFNDLAILPSTYTVPRANLLVLQVN